VVIEILGGAAWRSHSLAPVRVQPHFFGGITGRLRCAATARLHAVNPAGSFRVHAERCPDPRPEQRQGIL